MKNLADLKRTLVLGRELKMLSFNGVTPPEKLQGVREVVAVQTNGVYLGILGSRTCSWFDFPKANELEIHTEKHFTIRNKNASGAVWGTREYLIQN